TRDEDDRLLIPGKRARHLQEQRRLANAGIAAQEQHRAAHESAAGDAIELGNAGSEPRRRLACTAERLEGEQAALATPPALGAVRSRGAFLGDGVPLAAGFAFALPAAVGRTAALANKAHVAPRHGTSPQPSSGSLRSSAETW